MTSEPKKAVLIERNSQRVVEGLRCYEATACKHVICFNRDLNGGCKSRLLRIPVDTALIIASDLADDLVRPSDKQSTEPTCARDLVSPEQVSLRLRSAPPGQERVVEPPWRGPPLGAGPASRRRIRLHLPPSTILTTAISSTLSHRPTQGDSMTSQRPSGGRPPKDPTHPGSFATWPFAPSGGAGARMGRRASFL